LAATGSADTYPTTRRPAATDGKVNPFETLGAAMVALHTPDCSGTYNRNMTLNETPAVRICRIPVRHDVARFE
jgi:hypothetical protein